MKVSYKNILSRVRKMFRKSNKVGVKVAKEGGSRANFKTEKLEEDYGKWKNPFIDLSSSAIAIRFKELDQCCFANVSCVSIIKEYCESSSLHGLRYITEDGRHWTERVLWVFLCLLGFILTVYFIIPIYIKWYLKPTLTTLDSTNHPIWKIDFPGVTVCPANKAIEAKLNQIKDQEPWKSEIATNGISLQEIKRLIEIMVHFDDYETVNSEYSDLQGVFERVGQGNLTNLMVHVMSTCDEYILKCWWKGQLIDCKKIFEIRKTDNGFCCSFNTIQPTDALDTSLLRNNENINDDWISQYYDHGEEENTTLSDLEYLFKEDESALPQIVPNFFYDYYTALTSDLKGTKQWNNLINRQNSASPERGLSILLDSKSKDYFVSSDNFIGFKILVHDPQSYPEVKGRSLIIGPGKESFMTIAASHTEGSDSIRKLPIERRNCLFSDERKVKESKVNFFKDYSQENCYLECRAKHLLQKCGCLPYYYPPLDVLFRSQKEYEHLNSTCDWNGWNCLANSTQLLEAIDPNFHISKTSWDDGAPCNCPPACTRTDYSATQSSADLNPKAGQSFSKIPQEHREKINDLTLVHIFFRELKIFKYSTDELFSWNDILAAFGGLVGLCTGFSFLSLAELVYFFTLRVALPFCRKKRMDKLANLDNIVVVKMDD